MRIHASEAPVAFHEPLDASLEVGEVMQDGAEGAVPVKTNPESPEAPEGVFVAAEAARPNLLFRVAQEDLHGKEKREKEEGADEVLLEAPVEAADAAAEDVEDVEVDEVVEKARLEDPDRRLLPLDLWLWEDEGVCLEVVERVAQLLPRRRPL